MARVGSGAHDRLPMASLKVGGMQKGGALQRLGSEPAPRSNRPWEDVDEELGEEDVWGALEAAAQQDHHQAMVGGSDNTKPASAAGARRSLLSMELQEFSRKSRGMAAAKAGIGFASLEAVAATNGHGGEVVTRKISVSGWREWAGGMAAAAAEVEEEEAGGVPQSAPVSVPVWMRRSRSCDMMEASGRKKGVVAAAAAVEEEEEAEGGWVPPHEMVARRQGMTSSVCEGAGRTLKGMDLRRVRNSVWSRTGFVD